MSDLIVPIIKLENIRPHPNADRLEVADALGYQVILPKGQYKNGDKVVYFPADTLLTPEWAKKMNITNYLKGKDKNRVGSIRLRGESSFGLVADLPEELVIYEVGHNVALFYRAEKYAHPIRSQEGNTAKYDSLIDPSFPVYTKIQNGRIFADVFKEGEEVVITEKIHGMNNRVGIISNGDTKVFVAGTHKVRRGYPEKGELKDNKAWFPFSLEGVMDLLLYWGERHNSVVLYGEVYGGSIQSLNYGIEKGKGLGYRVFDLMVDGQYFNWEELNGICAKFGVEIVPVLFRGLFEFDRVKTLADGFTMIPGAMHQREGVVVKPIEERRNSRIGRVILKYVGIEYSLSKKSDFQDI
jgi:RNA ligase (TIGR02306 family)